MKKLDIRKEVIKKNICTVNAPKSGMGLKLHICGQLKADYI